MDTMLWTEIAQALITFGCTGIAVVVMSSAEDEPFRTRSREDEPALGVALARAKQLNALLRRRVRSA